MSGKRDGPQRRKSCRKDEALTPGAHARPAPYAAFSSCPLWLLVPFVIKNTLAVLPAVAGQKSALICEICGFLTLAALLCVPLFSSVPPCVYKTSPDTTAGAAQAAP